MRLSITAPIKVPKKNTPANSNHIFLVDLVSSPVWLDSGMGSVERLYMQRGYKVIGLATSNAASLELEKSIGIKCMNLTKFRRECLTK